MYSPATTGCTGMNVTVGASASQERVTLMMAVEEIERRLGGIRSSVHTLTDLIKGSDPSDARPEQVNPNTLEGRIAGCFPHIKSIEQGILELIDKIGQNKQPGR